MEFEVRWRFITGEKAKVVHSSIVVARDANHAKERVWLAHVGYGKLRATIEFLEIKAVDH